MILLGSHKFGQKISFQKQFHFVFFWLILISLRQHINAPVFHSILFSSFLFKYFYGTPSRATKKWRKGEPFQAHAISDFLLLAYTLPTSLLLIDQHHHYNRHLKVFMRHLFDCHSCSGSSSNNDNDNNKFSVNQKISV